MTRDRFNRRAFFALAGRRGVGLGLAATSLPAILAACGDDDGATAAGSPTASPQAAAGAAIVGDVLEHALVSSDWQGAFGWVRLRLQPAVVDGGEAWYIRTDASNEGYADREGLVFVPKIAGLAGAGAAGEAFVFTNGGDDQPTVISSEPGRGDYGPAWRINEVTWAGSPTDLESSGPMGGQPSLFDSSAGEPAWSPYWDDMTYVWEEGADARVLTNESELHDVRDAGELEEFPGTPDTGGEIFTVNCPVPVVAPNTFTG